MSDNNSIELTPAERSLIEAIREKSIAEASKVISGEKPAAAAAKQPEDPDEPTTEALKAGTLSEVQRQRLRERLSQWWGF